MTVPILLGEDIHVNYEIGTLRDQPLGSRLILPGRPGFIPASSSKGPQSLSFSIRKTFLEDKPSDEAQLTSKPDKGVRAERAARALKDCTIEPESARLINIFTDDLIGNEWIVEGIVLQNEDGTILAAPTTAISRERAVVPLANPLLIPRTIRRGEIIGLLHDAKKWARTPQSSTERSLMESTAIKIVHLIESLSEIEEDKTLTWIPFLVSDGNDLADDFDPSGPKTAEVAINENLNSDDLNKLVNLGPDIPPRILPSLRSVLTKTYWLSELMEG
jgi:hypothetical protein